MQNENGKAYVHINKPTLQNTMGDQILCTVGMLGLAVSGEKKGAPLELSGASASLVSRTRVYMHTTLRNPQSILLICLLHWRFGCFSLKV